MNSSYKYKDLSDFLAKHNAKQEKHTNANISPTHTRIGDKELNIYGGSYIIEKEDWLTFHELYYQHIFVKHKPEYLTEKQLEQGGPLLVDFDFRYDYDVESRQHTTDHIQDMIILYLEELKQFFQFEQDKPFQVYIMEKPNVNRLQDGSLTKDGIHMIISIQMDSVLQCMLRDRMIERLPEIWDLPIINTWDKVLDDGISKGKTNWQMYGSRKPGNEAYELSQIFDIEYDKVDGEFMMVEKSVKDFDLSKNIVKLSAQYADHSKFDMQSKMVDEYNKKKTNLVKPTQTPPKKNFSKTKILLLQEEEEESQDILLEEIDSIDKLKRAVNLMLKNLKPSEQYIKETHDYTQILPAKYYEPGSHLLNRQVAFALKHTDDRLFLSWILLRSKASDFDVRSIPELFIKWRKHFNTNKDSKNASNIVTRKSIMYWAKQDAYDDFMQVKKSTIDYYLEETLNTPTEFDMAMVLYQIFKDRYVCCSITNKTWFVFRNHRWTIDMGQSLRLAISKDMHNVYQEKLDSLSNEIHQYETNDDRAEYIKKKMKVVSEICIKLKKTNDKNNIMREAMELFYDRDFIKNMDANRYLLCFNNGVIDFKTKEFRDGYPQDYITKSTNIAYYEYNEKDESTKEVADHIITFMEQLFPIKDLNRYMWNHLASTLIGINLNQTFNIYRGSGSNGKSMLTQLMSLALGEYKGTVPITLVTEKRNGIGGTSSEVIQLKGVRYAVMQEPSKEVKLNEGIMKELTGCDPIQARALYSESETFLPQFKLVVCTNALFEINSNDDGTWRRIRICDFLSKFVSENEEHTDSTAYIFPKDKELEEKLPNWAPVFASMLVKLVFETNGYVEDCDIVKASSNRYRQGQDHIAAFVDEMVVKTGNLSDKIKKTEITTEFKTWFQNSQGVRKQPKGVELYEYMDKRFGKCKPTGWHGVKIFYPEATDEVDELQN